jgi:branched-chain amino acid transport system ATP-binding protein
MAIVLVEHIIKIVHDLCQSVTVLDSGEVIAEGSPEAIRHDPRVIQAYLGQTMSQSFARPMTLPATTTPQTPSIHAVQHGSRPTARDPVMLDVTDVDSYYGPLQVLKRVSLRVHGGEVVALLGGNGSGKSTLLRTISGFIRPRRGTVTVAGQPLQGQRPDTIVHHGVIHVPQGREIFPMLTVLENLSMGAYRRHEPAAIARDLERVYTYFPILAERTTQYAGYLSGGEQQMLAIGRGLMAQPTLLLLDEPSASLAPLVIDDIFRVLTALKTDGLPLLIVEQNVHAALAVADYVYVLRHGAIVTQGTPEALQQGETLYQAYLGR